MANVTGSTVSANCSGPGNAAEPSHDELASWALRNDDAGRSRTRNNNRLTDRPQRTFPSPSPSPSLLPFASSDHLKGSFQVMLRKCF